MGGLSTQHERRESRSRTDQDMKTPVSEICPLCGEGRDRQRLVTTHIFGGDGRGAAFFHCHSCDVRYQNPRLSPDEEKKFYEQEFEAFMEQRSGVGGGWDSAEKHILSNEPNRRRRMLHLKPFLRPGAKILEVGCSSGFMLNPLLQEGYACVGVEPSGKFSKYLRQKGISVFNSMKDLAESGTWAPFGIIMHFFVLEHIVEPLPFLQQQLGLLEPGGTLFFEIPNVADPLLTIYKIPEFEKFYWSVAHPWYFSEKSLHHLLATVGVPYEICRDQRYDLSNHMVWARDGRPGGMGRFSHFWGDELDHHYKQALIRGGICDTLIGILRKPK